MILAASYPLLEIFWTILVFFAFVVWLMILFTVLSDIFRRHDVTGGSKVLWILVIVLLPYLGTFVYLITQHNGITERAQKQQHAAQAHFDSYVQSVAAKRDPTEQIAKAKDLLDGGAITQAEFEQLKQRALASA
jgi:predicted PurR-regulated permease PerM